MAILSEYGAKLAEWWTTMSTRDLVWLGIGLGGQSLFVLRWFMQWWASERAGRLVVPDAFWYASLLGGLLVMAYGIQKPDPVIVLGQFGVIIYGRNLYFIMKQKRKHDVIADGGTDRPQSAESIA
jgi:lipid-A-disaccharide synthase-like uncharacterized protein